MINLVHPQTPAHDNTVISYSDSAPWDRCFCYIVFFFFCSAPAPAPAPRPAPAPAPPLPPSTLSCPRTLPSPPPTPASPPAPAPYIVMSMLSGFRPNHEYGLGFQVGLVMSMV